MRDADEKKARRLRSVPSEDRSQITSSTAIDNPRVYSVKCRINQRLAWFREEANAAFWDEHWRQFLTRDEYTSYANGHLGPFGGAFVRHLPRGGRVIEAGCGIGQYVMALQVRGYDIEGVEWAEETVNKVHKLFPDLPVRQGDVRQLAVPDGYYTGYISLGVMEHDRNGPERFLTEANRILARDGVAFISVPFVNRLRQVKRSFGSYHRGFAAERFYQYAFDRKEFCVLLGRSGFRPVEMIPYDGFHGLIDESALARWMFNWGGFGKRMERIVEGSRLCDRYFGHMMLFVCRKENRKRET